MSDGSGAHTIDLEDVPPERLEEVYRILKTQIDGVIEGWKEPEAATSVSANGVFAHLHLTDEDNVRIVSDREGVGDPQTQAETEQAGGERRDEGRVGAVPTVGSEDADEVSNINRELLAAGVAMPDIEYDVDWKVEDTIADTRQHEALYLVAVTTSPDGGWTTSDVMADRHPCIDSRSKISSDLSDLQPHCVQTHPAPENNNINRYRVTIPGGYAVLNSLGVPARFKDNAEQQTPTADNSASGSDRTTPEDTESGSEAVDKGDDETMATEGSDEADKNATEPVVNERSTDEYATDGADAVTRQSPTPTPDDEAEATEIDVTRDVPETTSDTTPGKRRNTDATIDQFRPGRDDKDSTDDSYENIHAFWDDVADAIPLAVNIGWKTHELQFTDADYDKNQFAETINTFFEQGLLSESDLPITNVHDNFVIVSTDVVRPDGEEMRKPVETASGPYVETHMASDKKIENLEKIAEIVVNKNE